MKILGGLNCHVTVKSRCTRYLSLNQSNGCRLFARDVSMCQLLSCRECMLVPVCVYVITCPPLLSFASLQGKDEARASEETAMADGSKTEPEAKPESLESLRTK